MNSQDSDNKSAVNASVVDMTGGLPSGACPLMGFLQRRTKMLIDPQFSHCKTGLTGLLQKLNEVIYAAICLSGQRINTYINGYSDYCRDQIFFLIKV